VERLRQDLEALHEPRGRTLRYWLPSATITRFSRTAELVPAGPLLDERHLGEYAG
jgi:hypothetical protein